MISSANKKVRIYITTYKVEDLHNRYTMDRSRLDQNQPDKRLLCSICLKTNGNNNIDCYRYSRPCPICCKTCTCETKNDKTLEETHSKHRNAAKIVCKDKSYDKKHHVNTKDVQTSQTDITQDISLLKEVLTVFQNKKQLDTKTTTKPALMKDVSVETERKSRTELTAKLSKSRIFQFSIEEGNKNHGNNFKIINFCQPNNVKASQYSIGLSKHKSSSIPQMKIEELKFSLKGNTKSKDAIEEVNRMFATVRRSDLQNLEEHNRPMIRNGPRVLPVVKTNIYHDNNRKNSHSGLEDEAKGFNVHKTSEHDNPSCKCCQTKDLQLSGGDSFCKHECCYHKMLSEGRCEKCVYMLCRHYQKHNCTDISASICEYCKKNSNNPIEIP